MKLGQIIKKARKKTNLTQIKLGKILNCTRQVVYKWECGNRNPSLKHLVSLSKILNIDLNKLKECDL